jgi:hypothetical protein
MRRPRRKGDEHARDERAERETDERRHAVERRGPLRRRIGNERAKRRQRDARRDPLHGARSDERRGGFSDKEHEQRDRVEPKRQRDHRLAPDIIRQARNRQKPGDHREGIDGEDEGDRERGEAQHLVIESVDRRRRARDGREGDRRQRRIDRGEGSRSRPSCDCGGDGGHFHGLRLNYCVSGKIARARLNAISLL